MEFKHKDFIVRNRKKLSIAMAWILLLVLLIFIFKPSDVIIVERTLEEKQERLIWEFNEERASINYDIEIQKDFKVEMVKDLKNNIDILKWEIKLEELNIKWIDTCININLSWFNTLESICKDWNELYVGEEVDIEEVVKIYTWAILETYKSANWTELEFVDNMKKYNWSFNSNWLSKRYWELEWDTVEWRTYSFLKIYWLEDTMEHWMEFEKKHKIKYSLPICIARADSWLWTQLKSKNNIWNVWNNDSWNTVRYSTLVDWIEAIYRVLNNQYLQNIRSLWYLSQWGRDMVKWEPCTKSWEYCYATSKENWGINVKNCLSTIYNKPVDETYEFRIN